MKHSKHNHHLLEKIDLTKFDEFEFNPVIGLDRNNKVVQNYQEAVYMEAVTDGDNDIICYGVYGHYVNGGLACLFDVVDKKNAEAAVSILTRLKW